MACNGFNYSSFKFIEIGTYSTLKSIRLDIFLHKITRHFIADTMDVTECHFSFNNRFLCTYWAFDKSFTILDVESMATGGVYRQVSEKEVLGKFRGQWWTGQILFTAGKFIFC